MKGENWLYFSDYDEHYENPSDFDIIKKCVRRECDPIPLSDPYLQCFDQNGQRIEIGEKMPEGVRCGRVCEAGFEHDFSDNGGAFYNYFGNMLRKWF